MASNERTRSRADDAFDELDDEIDEFDEGMRKSPEGENPLDSEEFQRVMADTIVSSLKSKRTGADSSSTKSDSTTTPNRRASDKKLTVSGEGGNMSDEEKSLHTKMAELSRRIREGGVGSEQLAKWKAEKKELWNRLKSMKGAK